MAKAVLKNTSGGKVNVPDLDLSQVHKIKDIPALEPWKLETTDLLGNVTVIEFEGGRPKR
jgi:hypothetical protein